MTIEFRCPGCEKLLRVKDESAGKQAQCPECGTVSRIPGPEPAAPVAESGNPFQSPMTASPMVSMPVGAGEIVPKQIEMGDVFASAWLIFKDRWQTVLGAAFLIWVIMAAAVVFFQALIYVSDNNLGLTILAQIPLSILSIYLSIGMIKVLLGVARGEATSFSDIFAADGKLIVPYFLASFLAGIVVQVGFFLLIVPGIILALMLSQVSFLIVDRRVGVFESLRLSYEITRGNKLTLLAMILIAVAGVVVLSIITCGIAAIVILPYLAVVAVVTYLKMTGQPTSAM